MIDKETLIESLHFRHACKVFDENKKIPAQDLEFILEAGRLSPSSFGMEHWRFLIIQDESLKAQIRPLCWDQKQITTCSDLVIVLSKTQEVVDKEYYSAMLSRRDLPQERIDAYLELYANFINGLESIEAWSAKQCYIAATNMMSYAALIGIDSCAIEGFEKKPLEKLLEIPKSEDIAMLIPFGYRIKPQSSKMRLPLESIVEYR
jgi:nitroreductase